MVKDYSKAKIYKLVDPDGFYYYGSTCTSLSLRFTRHKMDSKLRPESKVYQHFLEVGWNNVQHILVTDECNVENEDQLRQFENTFIEPNLNTEKCLNTFRSFYALGKDNFDSELECKRVAAKLYNDEHIEEHKQYREAHKEQISERKKQYRENNKEKIKQSRSERIECVACKIMINKDHQARHNRTKKHLANLSEINFSVSV